MLSGQKHDAVPGRVAAIPLQLVIRYLDLRSRIDVRATVEWRIRTVISDRHIGLAITDVNLVSPVSISLTATKRSRYIRLRQSLVPLIHLRVLNVMRPNQIGG